MLGDMRKDQHASQDVGPKARTYYVNGTRFRVLTGAFKPAEYHVVWTLPGLQQLVILPYSDLRRPYTRDSLAHFVEWVKRVGLIDAAGRSMR